jgi:thiol-disulfide isomerase/thioredoxin
MKNKILISSVIFIVVGLFVIGRVNNSSNTVSQSSSLHNSALGITSQENPAPDFTLQKLDGGTVTLSEFKGKKPVVVDFWASGCPNCRRDMPNLNRFYEKYKDKVEIIGVNLQENENTVKDFIASRGISLPIALDPYSEVSRAFGIQYSNTHFLVDINGNLVRTIPGDIRESDIISLIN